jgi:hypothetical protein
MYATLLGILATPLAPGVLAWWLQPPAPPRPPATPPADAGGPCRQPPTRAMPILPLPERHGEAP